MESQTRQQEDPLVTIVEQSIDGIVIIDAEGIVQFANSAARGLFAHAGRDLVGLQLGSPAVDRPVELVVAGGAHPRTVELRAREIVWEGSKATLANLRDITEHKASEAALRESEQRFRRLFDNSVDAIMVADRRGWYVDVNAAACELFGYTREELLGMRVADLVVPESEPGTAEQNDDYAGHGVQSGTFSFVRPDGARRTVEYSAFPLSPDRFASVLRDVTQRTELENRVRQTVKMEAVGQLAGGIAHDFNNLITAIISYARFVRKDLDDDDPRGKDVDEILRAAARGGELTQQFLAFSRRQPIAPRHVDLNALVQGIQNLLARTLGRDIEFVTRLGDGLGRVLVDPGQFEHVITNLAVNARDAMPEGGTLVIETANEDASEAHATAWVVLRVRDDGAGMSEAIKARVFEPFFTTKEQGKGTGLGLSTVYGLVTQAGGRVSVQSEPGRGTCFEVRLPRVDAEGVQVSEIPAAVAHAPGVGHETVLVVEDEPIVRQAAVRILSRHGYRVLEAADGAEALAVYGRHGEHIELVVCDVVMPKMNGPEAMEALKAKRPDLKVLFTSGYADEPAVRRAVLGPRVDILRKPFTEQSLLTRLRQLLD